MQLRAKHPKLKSTSDNVFCVKTGTFKPRVAPKDIIDYIEDGQSQKPVESRVEVLVEDSVTENTYVPRDNGGLGTPGQEPKSLERTSGPVVEDPLSLPGLVERFGHVPGLSEHPITGDVGRRDRGKGGEGSGVVALAEDLSNENKKLVSNVSKVPLKCEERLRAPKRKVREKNYPVRIGCRGEAWGWNSTYPCPGYLRLSTRYLQCKVCGHRWVPWELPGRPVSECGGKVCEEGWKLYNAWEQRCIKRTQDGRPTTDIPEISRQDNLWVDSLISDLDSGIQRILSDKAQANTTVRRDGKEIDECGDFISVADVSCDFRRECLAGSELAKREFVKQLQVLKKPSIIPVRASENGKDIVVQPAIFLHPDILSTYW